MRHTIPLHLAIYRSFHLDPPQIQQCKNYFILHWQCRHLYSQLHKAQGQYPAKHTLKDGIKYQIVYLDDLSPEYLSMHPEETIRLSFRRLHGYSEGVVIVAKVPGKHHTFLKNES
jgi:hypothetical protein